MPRTGPGSGHPTSRGGPRPASSRPDRRRPRVTGAILALLVLFAAAPALSDPVRPDSAASGCWSPGDAPALFAWSGTPGIACRDGAGVSGAPGSAAAAAAAHGSVPGAAQGPGGSARPAEVTFSGSAYVGVAVAF